MNVCTAEKHSKNDHLGMLMKIIVQNNRKIQKIDIVNQPS